jgi:hypothetical protein
MRCRWFTRVLRGCVVAILILPACSSGDGAEDPPPAATASGATGSSTGPTSDPGTTGASTAIDACALITEEDAEIALGAEIEEVEDPFGEGFLEGDPAEFAGVCAYRPIGVNDGRVIAIGVAAPGSITPEEFDELTEGAIPLGGPGDEGYALDGGVLFRDGDLIVGIVVHTGEGMDTDRALALELAGIAAAGLSAAEGAG